MKTRTILIGLVALGISACATPMKLSDNGKKVRVLDPSEVSSCRELGKTNTSVTPILLGIERPEEAIGKELRIVARNSAARMGGDTIVPLTVIDKGQQTFVVYKCVNPDG